MWRKRDTFRSKVHSRGLHIPRHLAQRGHAVLETPQPHLGRVAVLKSLERSQDYFRYHEVHQTCCAEALVG